VALKYRPKGYVGHRHETIGSDILSVAQILKLPAQTLGPERAARLAQVKADKWYPISELLELMDALHASVGDVGLMRMGRSLFDLSHKANLQKVATSARQVLYMFDDLYHYANRGEKIGGWHVLRFDPGYAELENTTPHHCMMEQGILTAALSAVGCPSTVDQSQCIRTGSHDCCIFRVTSMFTDARWNGTG
jgi:hypothetical protein